jgi:hypothetical protein
MLHRRRFRVPGAVLAAAITASLLAACSGSSPSVPARPSDPAAVRTLTRAIAATRAAGTVHVQTHATGGPNTATYSSDASATAGRQVITATNGGHATVLEINGVGYFKANATALVGFLGLPAAVAKRVANKWIEFHASDVGYQRIIAGVTIGSLADELALSGGVRSLGKRQVGGQSVVALRGGVPAAWGLAPGVNATLYVAAAGQPLPVTFTGGITGGQGEFLTFSKWGEPVHLTAPASSIPSSSVMTS